MGNEQAHHANTTKDEPEVKLESSNDNSTAKQTTDPPSTAEAAPKDTPYDNEGEEEEEEEETCGFCIFMKGGGCKDAFDAWSKCVDKERESGNDFTEECREVTLALRECMLAHKDYYAPLLEEEEEAARLAAEEVAAGEGQEKDEGPTEVLIVEFNKDEQQQQAEAGEQGKK